jgi:hypothetical protein
MLYFSNIQNWFHREDLIRSRSYIAHISIQDAYTQMLHELSTMDDRFYEEFDARKLKRQPTRHEFAQFAVSGKLIVLNSDNSSHILSSRDFKNPGYYISNANSLFNPR